VPDRHALEQYPALTREELDEIDADLLPERAALSLVNANLAVPINAALGLTVLSDGATVAAEAGQDTPIDQTD
jgi:hypothetical protein